MMLWMQAQTLVWITTRQTAQLKTGEEGHKAVQDYADWCCSHVLEPESQGHLDQVRLLHSPILKSSRRLSGSCRSWSQGEEDRAARNFLPASTQRAQRLIAQLEKHLAQHDWLSGGDKPGLGDFMLTYPLLKQLDEHAQKASWQRQNNFKVGPGLKAWLQRVKDQYVYCLTSLRIKFGDRD